MIRSDWIDKLERLARIDRLIEQHREAKRRQILRRTLRLWRQAEVRQQFAALDVPPERVH